MDGNHAQSPSPQITWSTEEIIAKRDKFYAASQRAFVPYEKPLILKRGKMQYVWDEVIIGFVWEDILYPLIFDDAEIDLEGPETPQIEAFRGYSAFLS